MDKQNNLTKTSKISFNIFYISLFVFIMSLVPISYNAGYSTGLGFLSGTAGEGEPPNGENNNTPELPADTGTVNVFITYGTAIISAISFLSGGFANWRKSRLEFETHKMDFQKAQLEYDMQKKEIDKLKLELELDKKKKTKRTVKKKTK